MQILLEKCLQFYIDGLIAQVQDSEVIYTRNIQLSCPKVQNVHETNKPRLT